MDVLTVGATDPDCKPGFFTSWGWLEPYVKPDLACRGQQAYVLSAETGKPITGNGTSYAAPFFCGLMASLWSAAPTLLPEQLRQAVRESSSQYTVPDTLIGYGMPDFRIALQEALRLSGASGLEEVRPQEPVRRSFRYYDLQGRPLPRDERKVPSNCKFIVEKDGKIRVIR
jgi:subtilisin family serine protease